MTTIIQSLLKELDQEAQTTRNTAISHPHCRTAGLGRNGAQYR
jgi:hypothetical protein